MNDQIERRDFLRLCGLGGVVFASGLAGCSAAPSPGEPRAVTPPARDFFFLQLSDTHWGFEGAPNPEAALTLRKTVATINRSAVKPDFVVFTGDLTHTTVDAGRRRARMQEFREIVAGISGTQLRFLPGEHDAALDAGAAFHEAFGESTYAFDHKGVHFVALDNVSDPGGSLGDDQISWLRADVERTPEGTPVVVFAHRPLFDLAPSWDWMTRDGDKAMSVLLARPNVTVFYGHIHQEHHHMTGAIAHHAARSLIFPLPAPGSAPARAPLPWDPARPNAGIGYRSVRLDLGARRPSFALAELPVEARPA